MPDDTNTTTEEWAVQQRGLDGERARGQVTLDGDVIRDGGAESDV